MLERHERGRLGATLRRSNLGPTQVVTLTVGVNDLGSQSRLVRRGTPGMGTPVPRGDPAMPRPGAAVPLEALGSTGAIRASAPNATIVVTGYPKLFGEVAKSCSIGNLGGTPVKLPASLTAMANMAIDGATERMIPSAAGPGLNDAIAGTVWAFAGPRQRRVRRVDPAFQTHRLCDTGDRWISGLVHGAPVTDRGLHPNMAGMSAFAGSILSLMP